LQSPIQSIPIKSPFVGPSPNANVPSVPPPPSLSYASRGGGGGGGGGGGSGVGGVDGSSSTSMDEGAPPPSKIARYQQISMANMSSLTSLSTSSLLFNYHQYKKCHSASIPIYLSEAGFLKMLSINHDLNNYSPLEIFLASYHLKKLLLKAFQNDTNTVILKSTRF
jgi:hypothetical protein